MFTMFEEMELHSKQSSQSIEKKPMMISSAGTFSFMSPAVARPT
jgi:hypothetical protein